MNGKFNQQSIATKANKLGIVKIKKWTDEETDIMKKYYSSIPLDEICKLLPNRKRDNIIAKAKNLNIKSYEYLQKHPKRVLLLLYLQNWIRKLQSVNMRTDAIFIPHASTPRV